MMALIKDTLYAKYIKEREGLEIIEDETSFLTYKILEKECFLANIKVADELKGSKKCLQIINQLVKIASDHGCEVITANIDLRDPGHDHTLKTALHLGFKTVRANGDVILIVKTLGGHIG